MTNKQLPTHSEMGGYSITYLDEFDNTLCPECANKAHDDGEDGITSFIHWEGADLYCEECGAAIESEYGDPEEEPEDIGAIQKDMIELRKAHIRKEAPWILGD